MLIRNCLVLGNEICYNISTLMELAIRLLHEVASKTPTWLGYTCLLLSIIILVAWRPLLATKEEHTTKEEKDDDGV